MENPYNQLYLFIEQNFKGAKNPQNITMFLIKHASDIFSILNRFCTNVQNEEIDIQQIIDIIRESPIPLTNREIRSRMGNLPPSPKFGKILSSLVEEEVLSFVGEKGARKYSLKK